MKEETVGHPGGMFMLSSHDVLAVLAQLRQGIEGLARAADLTRDPKLEEAIEALQQQLGQVVDRVEDAARKSGIVPTQAIQPRPTVHGKLSVKPEAA